LVNYIYFLFIVQSEKSKKAGNAPPTTSLVDFLRASYVGCSDIHLLEEDMNFNSRAASLSVSLVHFTLDECERWFFFTFGSLILQDT
jgi:hypothetical protein